MQSKKKILILTGLVIFAVFLVYSIKEYRQSGIAERGVITCAKGKCFWSAHIHVYVPVEICGKTYSLPKFEGSLSEFHTHGEENVIHWHEKLAYDPVTKNFLEPTPFLLRRTFEVLRFSFDEQSIFGKTDGDLCPDGSKGNWKVFVNGVLNQDWRNYEWKDHDIIFFVFDASKPEEIELRLRSQPFTFPALGEG